MSVAEILGVGGEPTVCYNPGTGEVIGRSETHTVHEVHAMAERARIAQRTWAEFTVEQRSRSVLQVRDYLVTNADDLARTISRNNGKTRTDAMATEVLPAIVALGYYAKHAERFLEDRRIRRGSLLFAHKSSKVVRVPYGVIGIISPWNYPFAIPISEVVMALLAGNAVLLKAASQTQLVGRALERAIESAALPPGLFGYVNLPGRMAGDALLGAGVDKLLFTGSVGVGKELMRKAADTLTPVVLELGGNDAMLVCADADLDRAAAGATWAGMQNAGQSCGGVERIYVHEAVYQPFLDRLAARVRALRVGFDRDFDVDVGAMTTKSQMNTVRRHIDDAMQKGATVYAVSPAPQTELGTFLPAMVLTGVNHDMLVMKEETFGPVVGVMKVADMNQAVELANDSDLGLTASVWSRNRKEAEDIARRIRAGVVTVNDHLMSHGLPETPWGGFKNSGMGRTHGQLGFDEMTQPQCIVHDYLPGMRKNPWWFPHGSEVYEGLKGLVNVAYGRGARKRADGLKAVVKLIQRSFRD